MADQVSIKVRGERELTEAVKNLGGHLPKALEASMKSVVAYLRAYIVKEKLSGNPLKRRTGRLASSIYGTVRKSGQGFVGVVGTNVKYAKIHEFGGVIRPKRGPYLVIPIRAGSPEAARLGISGESRAFSSKIVRYMRVKKVTIPKRAYMAPSIEENRGKISDIFRKTLINLSEAFKRDAR